MKFIFLILVQIKIFWLVSKEFPNLRSSIGHGLVRKTETRAGISGRAYTLIDLWEGQDNGGERASPHPLGSCQLARAGVLEEPQETSACGPGAWSTEWQVNLGEHHHTGTSNLLKSCFCLPLLRKNKYDFSMNNMISKLSSKSPGLPLTGDI